MKQGLFPLPFAMGGVGKQPGLYRREYQLPVQAMR